MKMKAPNLKRAPGRQQRSLLGSANYTVVGIIALLALAAVATYFLQKEEKPAVAPVESVTATVSTESSQVGEERRSNFGFLKGRWARLDGDYVLEIRSVDVDGQLRAAYYNPAPIKVSRAEVKMDGAAVKIFVELNDYNYPGCKYNLTYIPKQDRLVGTYYQAALRETYDVMFERLGD